MAEYQLVLQFPCNSMQDFDAVVAAEEELISVVGHSAEVDGHDAGSGEANIFVLTSEPAVIFKLAMPLLQQRGLLTAGFKAAFRSVVGSTYTVLWPEGTSEFNVL